MLLTPRFPSLRTVLLLLPALILTTCSRDTAEPVLLANEAPPVTTIMIDTRQITVIPPHFFGYDADMPTSPLSYSNRRVTEAVKPLHPGAVSFPGASVANAWEWLPGLVRDEWLSQIPSPSPRDRVAETNLIKGGSSLRSFLDATRALGAEPICVANVLHQKPSDSVQWLQTAKALGQPVQHWELGRDLWKPEYRQSIPTSEAYIALAQAHAGALRAADPNVRIAVGIPAEALLLPEPKTETAVTTRPAPTPKVVHKKRSSRRGRRFAAKVVPTPTPMPEVKPTTQALEAAYLRSWVAQIALQSFYDAVALDLNFALRTAPGTTPEYMQYAICRQAHERIENTLSKHIDWFRNKDIWVSQWSVNVDRTPGFAGSLLHGLALADVAIALANQTPQVKRLCYSDMIEATGLSNDEEMRAKMDEQFKRTGKIADASRTKPRFDNIVPATHILRMLGELFATCDRKAAIEVYQPPLLTPSNTAVAATTVALQESRREELPPAVTAMALMSPDGSLRIVAINHSKQPQMLRLVVNSNQMGGKVRARVLSGKTLMALQDKAQAGAKPEQGKEPGPKKKDEPVSDQKPISPKTVEWDASRLKLPPYSFSILESQV